MIKKEKEIKMKNYDFLENMINSNEQSDETEYYYLEKSGNMYVLCYGFYDGNLDLILKDGEAILEKIENGEIEEVLEVAKKYFEKYENYDKEKYHFFEFFETKDGAYNKLKEMYKNNLLVENQLINLIEIIDEIENFLNEVKY